MTGNIRKHAGGAAILRLALPCLSAALLLAGLSSCDRSAIYEYEGDCSATYLVQFRYDYNMKWADAFAHEVESVTLYLVDQGGRIVWQKTEAGTALAEEGYAMSVDITPGQYSLLTWCGTKDNGSFIVPEANEATGLTCTLDTKTDAEGGAYVDGEVDRLYYGWLADQEFTDEEGTHVYTVDLVKDTNTVRVVVQRTSGEYADAEDFTFKITADNGLMGWDNSLLENDGMTYYAFYTGQGEAEIDETRAATRGTFSAAIAEFTIGRMVVGHSLRLTVINNANENADEAVFSIPLLDIAVMVKGYYNQDMSDQEYLDRQDEYDLVFFLDEGDRWITNYIYINSWKLVFQTADL
ncbi:MAG: FimB/Mfa2 family fimbrial subunit [Bacteroidales bacterium]|nr:FimB/Mfa2 family fimbrial subunit [Bacteroidales bacterium]